MAWIQTIYFLLLFLQPNMSVITFSPVSVTMSRGPYMKRPVSVCTPSSVNTASFTRWLAVTFWEATKTGNQFQFCKVSLETSLTVFAAKMRWRELDWNVNQLIRGAFFLNCLSCEMSLWHLWDYRIVFKDFLDTFFSRITEILYLCLAAYILCRATGYSRPSQSVWPTP